MTNRKLEFVYEFIYTAIERQGYAPTVQEIAAGCYLDEHMVVKVLEHLEQSRRISCNLIWPRGIRIVELDRCWQQSDQIYTFIRNYVMRRHFSPSMRDITNGCGLGLATVYKHLSELQADGRIRRRAGRARTITLPTSIAS